MKMWKSLLRHNILPANFRLWKAKAEYDASNSAERKHYKSIETPSTGRKEEKRKESGVCEQRAFPDYNVRAFVP